MTPAVDAAKKLNIQYRLHEYQHDPAAQSYGLEAAEKIDVNASRVYKTLVVSSPSNTLAVAVLPVNDMLNMKAMAKALGWKKASMAEKNAVMRSTGYVLGGVSPLGQKKRLATVLHSCILTHQTVFVSAGKRGLEIELQGADLQQALQASIAPIINE